MMDTEPPMLTRAPPLDPAWLIHEATSAPTSQESPPSMTDPVVRQVQYATACRTRNAALLAPGGRDHDLSESVTTATLSIPSRNNGHNIPILRYTRTYDESPFDCVLIYYHGGGLTVGDPDSEDLSCRRLAAATSACVRLYSVGYRLKPQHRAQTSLDDSIDAYTTLVRTHHDPSTKFILVGSSSGGQLAALVAQHAMSAGLPLHGVLLRCPVTSDAFRGEGEYVPARFRSMHSSAQDPSFRNSLLERLDMDGPRDGLARMPLEAEVGELRGMPRTWVQLCTNDVLYSDGTCYVRLLREAGVQVGVHMVEGWPHTFWLKAPHLPRALEAEEGMIEGLRWVLGFEG